MAKRKPEKVTDSMLVGRINAELSDIRNDAYSLISEQRIQSNYAYANIQTNATVPTTNMSSVKFFFTPSVVNTLTSIQSKVFCSNKDTVKFNSSTASEMSMAGAKQLGMMVNSVLHKENPGFQIITEMFRSAGVNKNSIAKVTWGEEPEAFEEEFSDVDELTIMQIMQDREDQGYDVEVIEQKVSAEVEETVVEVDPETGAETIIEAEGSLSDYTLRFTRNRGFVEVMVIPPEEFFINEDTTSINDDSMTRFVAHRKEMYESDLQEMFPKADLSDVGPGGSNSLYDEYETRARHDFDQTMTGQEGPGEGPMRRIMVTESWIRSDRNRDGFAEWRHCFSVGNHLLEDEEWYGPLPFASFTYFPVPHKFYGLSVYDKIHSYEETATSLVRADVDMARLKNTYRIFAKDGTVDQRTLQSGRPGVIRVSNTFDPGDVMPVPSPAGDNGTIARIEELRKQVIADIGVDPINGSISTDIEKSGNDAAKTAMAIDNSTVKNEAYSRMFAEGALRDIVWLIAMELVKHADDPFVVNLRESVTPELPGFIAAEMGLQSVMRKKDITAMVGLGHQTSAQKIAAMEAVLPMVQQLETNPTTAMYNLVLNGLRGFGYEQPEEIIGSFEFYQQKAEENAQMLQLQQQAAQQQQAQLQLQQQQVQQQMTIEADMHEFEKQLKLRESEAKSRLDMAKAAEAEAQARKAAAEATVAERSVDQITAGTVIPDINVGV